MHAHMRTCMHAHMHTNAPACPHTCTLVHMRMRMHACMHKCTKHKRTHQTHPPTCPTKPAHPPAQQQSFGMLFSIPAELPWLDGIRLCRHRPLQYQSRPAGVGLLSAVPWYAACVSCLHHVCCMDVACVLHICCMCAACMLHIGCMYTAYVLPVCYIYAAYMSHV